MRDIVQAKTLFAIPPGPPVGVLYRIGSVTEDRHRRSETAPSI